MADLKGRSVRGGAITLAAQAIKFLLLLTNTVILARLLTPRDFGLVAMVTSVTGFVGMFKDLGLSQATVQRAEITHAQVSTLFWINVVVSVLLMLLVACLSPLLAWFYGDPRLVSIALVIAGTFILGGLSVQHIALLMRQMRFKGLALIDVLSLGAGVLVALVMAWWGSGYWSLVGMPVAQSLLIALLAWAATGWRPGMPVQGSGVRPMLRFGGNVQGVNLTYYLISNLDNLVIGRIVGPMALGLYGRAFQLLTMPFSMVTTAATRLAIPSLSRLNANPQGYKRYFRAALELVAMTSFPLVGYLLVMADDLVLLMLGSDWMRVALLFQLLGPAAIVLPVLVIPGWVCISTGTVWRQFRWCLVFLPLFAVAFLVGGTVRGAEGVAVACSLMNLVFFATGITYCLRDSHVTPADVFAATWRPLLALGIAVYFSAIFGPELVSALPLLGRLGMIFLIFISLYSAAYLVAPGARPLLTDVVRVLRGG